MSYLQNILSRNGTTTPANGPGNPASTPTQPGTARDEGPALVPAVDVIEDSHGITLLADMPGADKESLAIDVDGDTLTLQARFDLGESTGTQPVYMELRAPRYRRSFTLSRELDTARIEATLKDGVLQLRVPKLEEARPRRIEVRTA